MTTFKTVKITKGVIFAWLCLLSCLWTSGSFSQSILDQEVFMNAQNDQEMMALSKQKFAKNLYSNPDSARIYGFVYVFLAEKSNNAITLADAFQLVGISHDIQGTADSAIFYYNKSFDLFSSEKDSLYMSMILSNIGLTYQKQGDYEKAADQFYKSLNIKESLLKNGNHPAEKLMIGNVYDNLGTLSANRKQPDRSYQYYLKAKSAHKQVNDLAGIARVSNNLASYHINQSGYDSAIYYYKEALESFQNTNNQMGISIIYNNLAHVQLVNLQNPDSAIYYYEKSLPIRLAMNDKKGEALIKINLADAYLQKGRILDARTLAEDGKKLAADLNMKPELADAYSRLADVYQKLGNFQAAFENQKAFTEIKMELTDEQREKTIEELNTQYEVAKKEQSIAELELSNKEKQLENIQQRQQRNIFLFTAIFLLLMGILVFIQYLQKKKTNRLLEEKNDLISKALEEKSILMKEIHHRVKNNLQLISSLLNLQSKSIDDQMALQAINEGKSRVRSMALIHQDLYHTDKFTTVNVQQYFQKLCKELFQTYNINADRINLFLEIKDIELDVDTLVPLGLIVNELITNSLKYAFPDEKGGFLKVSLQEIKNQLVLNIMDNGVGFDPQNIRDNSFGQNLVKSLVNQLDGEMILLNNGGTNIEIILKEFSGSK